MSWPMSWPDIARDVLSKSRNAELDAGTEASLLRVQRRAQMIMRSESQVEARAAFGEKYATLRAFSATPREEGELEGSLQWTGDRFAMRLQGTAVTQPQDGKRFRVDGSYVGANIGNFMVSAGYMERWWGPGWEGSLIYSNNARPMPALTVERNYSDPFKPRLLRWIGPWRASIAMGQLESQRSDFNSARFFAARVSFKPLPQLELGLSRTAQWCGEGRPCNLQVFSDLLIGNDNQAIESQPGNQLAGYDVRWAFRSFPLALYGQFIGEDEAGGLPGKLMGLMGAESWGNSRWGQWRLHAEYTDTACRFQYAEPEFNCAYENTIFTQGYRYRHRSIGHSLDADGRMFALGGVLINSSDARWEVTLREIELNRDALAPQLGHTVTPFGAKLRNIELSHSRRFKIGQLRLGLGYDDYILRRDGGAGNVTRGFVQWSAGLGQ